MIYIDYLFTAIYFLIIHSITLLVSILTMGAFLFNSCFVYLSTLRILLFSMISELFNMILLLLFALVDFFSFFSFKNLCINQTYLYNVYVLGLYFLFVFLFTNALDGLTLPFEYAECESELVTGFVTEFSGIFFVVFSLHEINHTISSSIIIILLMFGGFFITLKVLLFFVLFVMLPKSVFCRIRMSNAIYISLAYTLVIIIIYVF